MLFNVRYGCGCDPFKRRNFERKAAVHYGRMDPTLQLGADWGSEASNCLPRKDAPRADVLNRKILKMLNSASKCVQLARCT